MIISRAVLLWMRNVSDISCREIQNTHFILNNFLLNNQPHTAFHGNNGCMQTPQCYVIRTSPVLFMFCINTTVRTGVCSGLKEWHLLSIGEGVISFDVFWGGGDQTYVSKCGKRRVGINVTPKPCDVIYGPSHRQKSCDRPLRHSRSHFQCLIDYWKQ